MADFRVIVTAWRDWPQEASSVIHDLLWSHYWQWLPTRDGRFVVVQGVCPYGGGDLWADQWALRLIADGGPVARDPRPADFKRLGKAAGPIRNQEMVNLGANLCLGFPGPGSKGTWDCLAKAVDAGIKVEVDGWVPGRKH